MNTTNLLFVIISLICCSTLFIALYTDEVKSVLHKLSNIFKKRDDV